MIRLTEVVILCEDPQQFVFVHRFLLRAGVNRHRISVRPFPAGKGSGEQYVREQFAREIVAFRRRASRKSLALIVVMDADLDTVNHAKTRLWKTVTDVGDDRQPHERIALLIPRRNIETWIHFLLTRQEMDEVARYDKLERESDCHPAADRIAGKDEYRLHPGVPPSLCTACEEIRRIFPQKRCVADQP